MVRVRVSVRIRIRIRVRVRVRVRVRAFQVPPPDGFGPVAGHTRRRCCAGVGPRASEIQ